MNRDSRDVIARAMLTPQQQQQQLQQPNLHQMRVNTCRGSNSDLLWICCTAC